jgi:hypothetical protein
MLRTESRVEDVSKAVAEQVERADGEEHARADECPKMRRKIEVPPCLDAPAIYRGREQATGRLPRSNV